MTHIDLVDRAVRWLKVTRRCGVVLREHYIAGLEAPDAIGWRHGGQLSIQVECKTSRADFFADQKKPCRRRYADLGASGRPAHESYYLTRSGLLEPLDLPDGWGLLEVQESRIGTIVRAETIVERDISVVRDELTHLYCEIRRYHAHNITYPKLSAVKEQRN